MGTYRKRGRHCNHWQNGELVFDQNPHNVLCSGGFSNSFETEKCEKNACPVDGAWSEWGPWDDGCTPEKACPKLDGGATEVVRYKYRTCTNPAPENGGKNCTEGIARKEEVCTEEIVCSCKKVFYKPKECALASIFNVKKYYAYRFL